MFSHNTKHKNYTLRQWQCCGNSWEILLSPKFPERYMWQPTCDTCNDLDAIINQAVSDGIFANYSEAMICASVTTPVKFGRHEPDIKALRQTIEVRQRGKNEMQTG
jgi:hypothetical protein